MANEQLKINELPVLHEVNSSSYVLAEQSGEFKRINIENKLINVFCAQYGTSTSVDIESSVNENKSISCLRKVQNGLAPGFYGENDELIVDYETVVSQGYNIESDEYMGEVLDSILLQYDTGSEGLVKKVVIPNTVNRIGSYAFHYESNWVQCGITTIIIPSSVTEIADYAFAPLFSSQANLRNIAIPNSVQAVGTNAFGDDSSACIYYGDGLVGEYDDIPEIFNSCSFNTFSSYASADDSIKYAGDTQVFAPLSQITSTHYIFTTFNVSNQSIIQMKCNKSTSEWAVEEISISTSTNM